MIRVLMLDLGKTLERNGRLLPHVAECLDAVIRFRTTDMAPLEYCLVSDFRAAVPFSEENVAEIFSDYLEILDKMGLRDLFEPVERRVTLSTHANVLKPDRRVFNLALQRLGVSTGLGNSLFITENIAHVAAVRDLGMECLQFGTDGPGGFTEWSKGLLQIALLVDPQGQENIALALQVLGQANGLEEVLPIAVAPERMVANAKKWVTLEDHSLGDLEGVHVSLPATLEVSMTSDEQRVDVRVPKDALEEATAFVHSLQVHGKVSGDAPSLLGGATHVVETDPSGRRILKRIGFD